MAFAEAIKENLSIVELCFGERSLFEEEAT